MDNEIFESLADLFVNDDTLCDLHLGSQLRCNDLDFTIDSLVAVDDFLEAHREAPGSDHETLMAVLRAGSYVGEVIRRASPIRADWLTFENAAPECDLVRQLGKQTSTLGVVRLDRDRVAFPLGKIVKFLHFGQEENLPAFVQSMITLPALAQS